MKIRAFFLAAIFLSPISCAHASVDVAATQKIAEQGDANAQFNLGDMYANDQGVPQSYSLAYTWLSVAIANGYRDQSRAISKRDALAAKLSPPQLAEAQKRAAQYFEQYQPRN